MTADRFGFRLDANDGAARAGTLSTAHGPVETPVFMPVGTAGTVKAMTANWYAPPEPGWYWAIPITSCCGPAPSASPGLAACIAS